MSKASAITGIQPATQELSPKLPPEIIHCIIEEVFNEAIHNVMYFGNLSNGYDELRIVLNLLGVDYFFRVTTTSFLIQTLTAYKQVQVEGHRQLQYKKEELTFERALRRLKLLTHFWEESEPYRGIEYDDMLLTLKRTDELIEDAPFASLYERILSFTHLLWDFEKNRFHVDLDFEVLEHYIEHDLERRVLAWDWEWDYMEPVRSLGSLASVLRRPLTIALQLDKELRIYTCIGILEIVYRMSSDSFRTVRGKTSKNFGGEAFDPASLAELYESSRDAIRMIAEQWNKRCNEMPIAMPDETYRIPPTVVRSTDLNAAYEEVVKERKALSQHNAKASASDEYPSISEITSLMDLVTAVFHTNSLRDVVERTLRKMSTM